MRRSFAPPGMIINITGVIYDLPSLSDLLLPMPSSRSRHEINRVATVTKAVD